MWNGGTFGMFATFEIGEKYLVGLKKKIAMKIGGKRVQNHFF